MEYIDLGLPSGKKWASENYKDEYGDELLTFKEAFLMNLDLPTKKDFDELSTVCKWTWDKERKGYNVTGPNGASIWLPANGMAGGSTPPTVVSQSGRRGYYWSADHHEQRGFVWCVNFYNDFIGGGWSNIHTLKSVRTVK